MQHNKSIIVGIIAAVTLGLMALDRTHLSLDDTPVAAHDETALPAPDVTFALLDGGSLKLHSLAGHTVLLHFWASWCVPCRKEFSDLLKHVKKSGEILLAVSGDKNAEDAQKFLALYQEDFAPMFASGKVLVAIDSNHHLIEGVFQTFQYPETIVIAPDLTMRHKIVGIYSK